MTDSFSNVRIFTIIPIFFNLAQQSWCKMWIKWSVIPSNSMRRRPRVYLLSFCHSGWENGDESTESQHFLRAHGALLGFRRSAGSHNISQDEYRYIQADSMSQLKGYITSFQHIVLESKILKPESDLSVHSWSSPSVLMSLKHFRSTQKQSHNFSCMLKSSVALTI